MPLCEPLTLRWPPMPTKRRPTGKTIQVDRIISVGRDRETGGAVAICGLDGRFHQRSRAVADESPEFRATV